MNKVVIWNESHLTMREAVRVASLVFPKTGEKKTDTMAFITMDDGSGVSLFLGMVDSELTIYVRGEKATPETLAWRGTDDE